MKVYFENGLTVIDTGDPVGGFKNKYGNDSEKAAMMAELSSLEQVEIFENGSRK